MNTYKHTIFGMKPIAILPDALETYYVKLIDHIKLRNELDMLIKKQADNKQTLLNISEDLMQTIEEM